MRIIHGRGFSEEERKAFAKCIFQNIFTAMKAMTAAMTSLKISYSNPENEVEHKHASAGTRHTNTPTPQPVNTHVRASGQVSEVHSNISILNKNQTCNNCVSAFQIYAKWLQDVNTVQVTQLEQGYVNAIRRLWSDMGIRICYSRRCEYQLLDSTE